MAGGLLKYRHLGRDSSARKALLVGLVTSLIEHEHIQTTYAKACEAQRLADKLITLAKKGNEDDVKSKLFDPHIHAPKLLGPLRDRYLHREGGYTRVVRTEPRDQYDQAESAILELVDGARDSRFMLTAKTVARDRLLGNEHTAVTLVNLKKVTRNRPEKEFEDMVRRYMVKGIRGASSVRAEERESWEDRADEENEGGSAGSL